MTQEAMETWLLEQVERTFDDEETEDFNDENAVLIIVYHWCHDHHVISNYATASSVSKAYYSLDDSYGIYLDEVEWVDNLHLELNNEEDREALADLPQYCGLVIGTDLVACKDNVVFMAVLVKKQLLQEKVQK